MNRIILIGNGFDLAHGLKTSYNDFIKDYWESTILKIQKHSVTTNFENKEIIIDKIPWKWTCEGEINYQSLLANLRDNQSKITFKNKFLKTITERKNLQNWVDIENEYYELLKHSFKSNDCKYNISELNKDFNRIKELLECYLSKVEKQMNNSNDRLMEIIGNKIYSDFKREDFTEKTKFWFDPIMDGLEVDVQPDLILFLSFNYTRTESHYWDHNSFRYNIKNNLRKDIIHIHGLLQNKDKPIVFGFGDEIGEDYKQIENLDNNEYLENIKSIQYLKTRHYKDLLQFINSDNYQIFIFGHSCGISDRTLLNTLFEHENCCSIKPFYHQINKEKDNYTDIVSNISRNFNDKRVMRDKVVNKEYCEPLS